MRTWPEPADRARRILLLGPQGRLPTLGAVLDEHGIHGRLATVTAGWQEREDEIQALQAHLGGRSENLRLYRRAEEVFAEDLELFSLHRERQARLKELQALYVLRLHHAMEALFDLLQREGSGLLENERRSALEAVRRLDGEHLSNVEAIHEEYRARLRIEKRPSVARHRGEIAEILESCEAVGIAGGHVPALLNRLRLFGIAELSGSKPLVGWSAGAMVLAERIVLYHDSPPQGVGNPAVFEIGLGSCRGVLPLPHAQTRLRLDDRARVRLFAERFAPELCLALDDGAHATIDSAGFRASAEARALCSDGRVQELAQWSNP
jgi:hypothetical protein